MKNNLKTWMAEHGVSAIRKETPNTSFYGVNANNSKGRMGFAIHTDGKVEKEWNSRYEGTYLDEVVSVSGATWAIVHDYASYGDRHHNKNVLYTMEDDVTSLELPELKKFQKKDGFGSLEYLVYPNGSYHEKIDNAWDDYRFSNFSKKEEKILSLGYEAVE